MKNEDLVFDLGVHKGEDSAFYLAKGYRVVGFEADPVLADLVRTRFRSEILSGAYQLVEGAISDQQGPLVFYRNPTKTEFGTLYPDWLHRNEHMGSTHEEISVQAVSFADALSKYGVPHYMKIDIEGGDANCLAALGMCADVPDYLSIESDKTDLANIHSEISTLASLGYNRFQAVQQRFIHRKTQIFQNWGGETFSYRFERGASGAFGSELRGHWKSADDVIAQYEEIFEGYRRWGDETHWKRNKLMKAGLDATEILTGIAFPGWFDTHAARS